MNATIEIDGLRKRFGRVQALDGMTFTVRPGQVTGFVGPNGAGKSTTMRVATGLDAPDAGTATIGGRPYRSLTSPLRHVGTLLDAGALQPGRRARDHLLWLAHSQGLPAARVDEVIALAGLESAARRRAGSYSLGMRQRLGIAAALLGDPPVLIFDEPFNGMDPEGIVWMKGFLRSLAAQGRAVLVSSHLMSELEALLTEGGAGHLVVVGRGKVIADTSVTDLLAAASGDRVTLRPPRPGHPRAGLHGTDKPERRVPGGGHVMTTGTVAPHRPTLTPARDSFWRLVHAEWTKLRTVRGWVIAVLVTTVGIAAFAFLGADVSGGCTATGSARPAACPLPPTGPGGEPVTDAFYFAHQPVTGNGTITVQMTSLTGHVTVPPAGSESDGPQTGPGLPPWSKAGIIIKQNTSQGSAYAAMMITGSNGVRMQWDYVNDTPGLAGTVSASAPRWLRLVRDGGTVTGYDSADGTHWTLVGTAALPGLTSTVQAGLFAAEPQDGNYTTATGLFRHIGLSWPATGWTGTNVGGAGATFAPVPGTLRQSAGTVTVTGSGDISPAVGSEYGGSGQSLQRALDGTFFGLIPLLVVAAMFITAEYRRGLIRVSLTAAPRRGRLLAAKAVVIGAAGFVAGLAGAALALAVGAPLLRRTGHLVWPVPALTEARMVVGTGALLAVAAVLALAIGTIVRRSAPAVAVVIVVILVPYLLAFSPLPAVAGITGAPAWKSGCCGSPRPPPCPYSRRFPSFTRSSAPTTG